MLMERRRVTVNAAGEDRAKQSYKESSDINTIMRKYVRGASIDHLARHGARYGDFQSQSFHEAMELVRRGQEMFAELPAHVRKRFGQSPELFMEFIHQDPSSEHLAEMRRLGLAAPAKPEPPKAGPLEVKVVETVKAP